VCWPMPSRRGADPFPEANVLAALDVTKRLGPEATVVTIMVDSGLKYLSTAQHKEA